MSLSVDLCMLEMKCGEGGAGVGGGGRWGDSGECHSENRIGAKSHKL